ncbi:MAG TPA: hypothetical protein VGS41_09925, partial [Chthonomonadales bacterium]|nr:hypothetical protein [Chthonomonadales bacterium]
MNSEEREPLVVFALSAQAPPLRSILRALQDNGFPVSVSLNIAGEAADTELDSRQWATAFVRFTEPELHDVWLLERSDPAEEAAAAAIAEALARVAASTD